ncbi:MAG: hypothetical protein JXB18_05510 [Sedimentisphaerales bacterium]|nr:hypothetical protein [Sedimentisphaerales bacterium]
MWGSPARVWRNCWSISRTFCGRRDCPCGARSTRKREQCGGCAYRGNRSDKTYKRYIEEQKPEIAANAAICLIHQTNYLLDQQLRALGKEFLKEGGFTERLYRMRSQTRKKD